MWDNADGFKDLADLFLCFHATAKIGDFRIECTVIDQSKSVPNFPLESEGTRWANMSKPTPTVTEQ